MFSTNAGMRDSLEGKWEKKASSNTMLMYWKRVWYFTMVGHCRGFTEKFHTSEGKKAILKLREIIKHFHASVLFANVRTCRCVTEMV
jgi:hypothetical protein